MTLPERTRSVASGNRQGQEASRGVHRKQTRREFLPPLPASKLPLTAPYPLWAEPIREESRNVVCGILNANISALDERISLKPGIH